MPVPLRHEPDGPGARAPRGRQAPLSSRQDDRQRIRRIFNGPWHHGHHPELVRHHGHGGRLCQLGPDDAASGHQRHHGRQRRHDRHGLAFEPWRHRLRQLLDQALKALILHSRPCAHRHHLLHVLQGQQEKGHRHDPARLCHAHVRHGDDERRGRGPQGRPRVHESLCCLSESPPRRARRRAAHGHHPVELCVCRYFAGARRHGFCELCCGHSHHHGPEHRHDRHGHAVVHRHEQKRPPRRGRSPSLQCHRRCRAADGLLHCARGFCARAAE